MQHTGHDPAITNDRRPWQGSAVVTGGSRGIGFAIARTLSRRGWALTLTARDIDQLEIARKHLSEDGAPVQVVPGDMASDGTIDAVLAQHQDAYGGMSALVLAAGVGSAAPLAGYPMHRFDKQFAVNVRSAFALVSKALPLLRESAAANPTRPTRVIAIASIEGVHPGRRLAAYGASKAALISLIQSVNAEEGMNGVLGSAISPAFVATELSAWTTDTIPFEEMITVSDVVKVVDLILNLSPNAVIPHIVLNRVGAGPFHA